MLKNKGPLKKPPSSNKIRKRTPALKKRKVRFGTAPDADPDAPPGAAPGAAPDADAGAGDKTETVAKQTGPSRTSITLTILAVVSLIIHTFVVFDVMKKPAYKIGLWFGLICVHVALAYLFFLYGHRALMGVWGLGSLLTIVVPLLYPMFEKGDDSDQTK